MAYEDNCCGDLLRRTRYGRNIDCPRNGTHVVLWNGAPLMKSHWDAGMRGPDTDKPWTMCETHAKRQSRSRPGSTVEKIVQ